MHWLISCASNKESDCSQPPVQERFLCRRCGSLVEDSTQCLRFLLLTKLLCLSFFPTLLLEKPAFAWSCRMEREWKL